MLVGASQIDITPLSGIELCGFAKRPQPSDHLLDPLFVRILYIDFNGLRILLINLDLIGVEGSFVQRVRSKLKEDFDVPEDHIQIFTTHTHSGPGTIHLNFCGEYAPDYLDILSDKIIQGCDLAMKNLDLCTVEFHEEWLELGKNRRGGLEHSLTKRLGIMTLRKDDNELKAVIINYAMHPVSMAGTGVSADYPGWVCRSMQEELPGNPLVIFGLAAAGDIDPPGVGVNVEQMRDWGSMIAGAALSSVMNGSNKTVMPDAPALRLESDLVEISLKSMDSEAIDRYADKYLADKKWNDEFGTVFPQAIEKWRIDMKRQVQKGLASSKVIELNCLMIGPLALLFINAELFSEFENLLRSKIDTPVMVISCANGLEGYLPDRIEYEKGGYEIETAIFFYNSFLPEEGSLELLAEEIVKLIMVLRLSQS